MIYLKESTFFLAINCLGLEDNKPFTLSAQPLPKLFLQSSALDNQFLGEFSIFPFNPQKVYP